MAKSGLKKNREADPDSWIAGAFYKVLTGRSIRGSKAKILSSLVIFILDYLRKWKPIEYRNLLHYILRHYMRDIE